MFESIDECGLTRDQAFAVGNPIAHAEAQASVLANAMQAAFDNADKDGDFYHDVASLMQVMRAHEAFLSELRIVISRYTENSGASADAAHPMH